MNKIISKSKCELFNYYIYRFITQDLFNEIVIVQV